MGWTLTSTLGPSEYDFVVDNPTDYDSTVPGSGVLSDSTGFGTRPGVPKMPVGVIGDALPEDDVNFGVEVEGKPSVSGALTELHNAVKDKLHSWNPYHKPGHLHKGGSATNKTLTASPHTKPNNTTTTVAIGGEHIHNGMSHEEQLGAKPRIGKCTMLFYGNQAWERALRTHERHDRGHGYRLHILRQ